MAVGTTKTSTSYDALEERVTNQGQLIRQLGEETAGSFRDMRAESSRMFTSLEASLKASTADAAVAYKALDTKFDVQVKSSAEANRPQYLALFVAMVAAIGVSITFIQWQTTQHDKPVDDKISSLTQLIGDLARNTSQSFSDLGSKTVSQNEYKLTQDYESRILAARTLNADTRRAEMQDQIHSLQGAVVGRNELDFHWTAENKIDSELQLGIDKLNTRLDSLAPASDTIRTLIERQHELEQKLDSLHEKPMG